MLRTIGFILDNCFQLDCKLLEERCKLKLICKLHPHAYTLLTILQTLDKCLLDEFLPFFPLDSSGVGSAVAFIAFIYSDFLPKWNSLEISKSREGLQIELIKGALLFTK